MYRLAFFAVALLAFSGVTAQGVPPPCCFDATCVYCEDVEGCENSLYTPEVLAYSGGIGACGIDTPTPCTSWTENNAIDGVCLPSCNDAAACNYDADAPSDLDCIYAEACEDCDGACLEDVNENAICDCFETFGCTDSSACNFNPEADAEDGTCTFAEFGFDCAGDCLDEDGDGVCLLDELHGCTDSLAINYYPFITEEDGSCVYPEDFATDCGDCPMDVNDDGNVTVVDVLQVLAAYGLACPR